MLGARPALGRLFAEGEDRPGRDRVAILTDRLWRALRWRSGRGWPADFAFDYFSPEPIELYVPFPMNDTYMSRNAEFANVRRVVGIGRPKPGNGLAAAAVELAALSETLAEAHPGLHRSGSDGRSLGFFMDAVSRSAAGQRPQSIRASAADRRCRPRAAAGVRQHRAVSAGALDRAPGGSSDPNRAGRQARPARVSA